MVKPKNDLTKTPCPKCGGCNLYLDSDERGWFEHCLQCGYTRDVKSSWVLEWDTRGKGYSGHQLLTGTNR